MDAKTKRKRQPLRPRQTWEKWVGTLPDDVDLDFRTWRKILAEWQRMAHEASNYANATEASIATLRKFFDRRAAGKARR